MEREESDRLVHSMTDFINMCKAKKPTQSNEEQKLHNEYEKKTYSQYLRKYEKSSKHVTTFK